MVDKYEKIVYNNFYIKALASFLPLQKTKLKIVINIPKRGGNNEVGHSIIIAFIFLDSDERRCQ
jgi:hypothetical protein